MNRDSSDKGHFTGRHMLAIMLAFFAVIIAVNLTMAMVSRTSWSGLVVTNSYIASQEFNGKVADARRQASLGWTAMLAIGNGTVRYSLTDSGGRPVAIEGATVTFRRPVGDRQDRTVDLHQVAPGTARAAATVEDGIWIVDVRAEVHGEERWRDTRRVRVAGGMLR